MRPLEVSMDPHEVSARRERYPFRLVQHSGGPLKPVLHPGTGKPIGPSDLAPLFPMALIEQEVSTVRYIDVPGPILDVYRLWRPTPLYRARRLEKALSTPAHIYYKYEGVSPAGSHKPNTAVAQAYYNQKEKRSFGASCRAKRSSIRLSSSSFRGTSPFRRNDDGGFRRS